LNEELLKKIGEISNRMEMLGKVHERKMMEARESAEEEVGRVQM
jgi:hypothetical protein